MRPGANRAVYELLREQLSVLFVISAPSKTESGGCNGQ